MAGRMPWLWLALGLQEAAMAVTSVTAGDVAAAVGGQSYQDEAHARAHQQARRAREAHVLGVYVSTMHGQLVFPSRSGCGRNCT